jgi:hypothetical protein
MTKIKNLKLKRFQNITLLARTGNKPLSKEATGKEEGREGHWEK